VLTGTKSLPEVSLPTDESEFIVRMGKCASQTDPKSPTYSCGKPSWLGPAKKIEVDPTAPNPSVYVTVEGKHPCWR
jgi:hypothetical protein